MLDRFLENAMAYTLQGRVYCPQKTKTLSRGQLDNVVYIPHVETTRALALTFQRDNTTEKGLIDGKTEMDHRQAQKMKHWYSSFDFFPILIRYATFRPPRRETSPRVQLSFRGCYRYVYVQRAAVCTGTTICTGTGTWVSGGSVGG